MGRIVDLFSRLKESDILLVDDDEWIRDALSIYFESEGCSISTCGTAEQALVALGRRRFDIIITDYKLPGIDGIAFLERIKNSHSRALKIMITAYPDENVIQRAKHAGALELLPKPITSEAIETCLSQLLSNSHRR